MNIAKGLASKRKIKRKVAALEKWFRVYWSEGSCSIIKAKSADDVRRKISASPYCKDASVATTEDLENHSLNFYIDIQEAKTATYKDSHGVLTVKDLKESLKNAPDSAIVMYQRIEDYYIEKNNWGVTPLLWEFGEFSEYIPAFSSYMNDGRFVINAHY